MKSKVILLLTALCCTTILYANGVKIGDIYYILNKPTKANEIYWAAVTYKGSEKNKYKAKTYRGDVVIPSKVTYKGNEYIVTTIGECAFRDCDITSIHIPPSIRKIEIAAFENNRGLKNVYITDLEAWFKIYISLQNYTPLLYAEHLFLNGEEVNDLVVPASVYHINKFLFYHFKGLRSLTIPDNCRSIGEGAFSWCKNIQKIDFGEGVEKIEGKAFIGCRSLPSITLPQSVSRIGASAFSECSNLREVNIKGDVTLLSSGTFEYCKQLQKITLPNSLEEIGMETFKNCTDLTSIHLPNSVKKIGREAFLNCEKLTSITLPSNLKFEKYYLAEDAFKGCKNLQAVYYPEGAAISILGLSPDICFAYKPKPAAQQPPLLAVVQESLVFADDNKNNIINADEQCKIRFKVSNSGKGVAEDCVARVSQSGSNKGISIKDVKLPSIPAGKTIEVTIPITADLNTQNGKVTFSVEVYEPNGFGVAPFDISVATKAYEAPFLQVVDYNIASTSGKIKKMEPFTISFNLQNTKYGTAENVKVELNLPTGVFVMDDITEQSFAQIKSGEVRQVSYTLIANNNYPSTDIPVIIDIKEKHGKFAENKQLNIALNQTTSSSINIAAKDEPQQERKEIQLAMMTAEVDRNIPKSDVQNKNSFVLIIANENYQSVASVPFALNDGRIFRQYCEQTLGIPAKNIHEIANATGNQLKAQINWLQNVVDVFDNPNVIFYYAGHGIPDESSKTAYLLPVDGSGTDVSTGYKLDDLYATLGNMPASQITVFMDACFSGSKREEGMLASARGVALKAKSGVPQGNMVVFSAAQGNETAYPNREKQHGLFTYYLLKKLQETEGDVSLQDLGDYIITNVKQQSILLNSKLQTPCVTPSATLDTSWQNWKLK